MDKLVLYGILAILLLTCASLATNLTSTGYSVVQYGTRSCEDSDDGKTFDTKGQVSSKTYYSSSTKVDSCKGKLLTEYYCSSYASPVSMTHLCENGCYDGACLPVAEPQSTASDCPARFCDGDILVQKGPNCEVLSKRSCNFGCYGGQCKAEKTCHQTTYCVGHDKYQLTSDCRKAYVESCKTGCANGVCTDLPNATCKDSDGGIIAGIRGNVLYSEGTLHSIKWDQCSGQQLTEHFCNGTKPSSTLLPCVYGCVNGQCKSVPQGITCKDSDNGFNIKVAGDAYATHNNMVEKKTDSCVSSNELIEYYCDVNSNIRSGPAKCTNGCAQGACVP